MLKFFRKIRQKLLSENKFSKYLLYAVGEIVLVVIGILIALQINNWNEAKKSKEKERQVLTEILSDLQYTLENCDYVIHRRENNLKKTIQSQKMIIAIIDSNQQYHDSLGIYFRASYAYDEVDYKTSGYQSLVSIGTDLINDAEIRAKIGKFYTSSISETKETFNEVKLDFHNYMIDYFREKFTSENVDSAIKPLHPNDFEALKKDKGYRQSLLTFLEVNQAYLERLEYMQDEIQILKKNIENYIDD
ncbi:DUF6090 family protein [Croceivirga thetidis]|uniref:Uncharacterized protein n=1 Tax=Croceivirga thetidis TaxID=2721623 RepID=A0ABX1GM05_9FLAO|nr:DUF6090 family protein [Croceivirga thetidis]NKI30947.1 hypothetical protein [Croceivirga thetidis]